MQRKWRERAAQGDPMQGAARSVIIRERTTRQRISRGIAMPRLFNSIRFAVYFSLRRFTDQAVNALLAARKHAVARRLDLIAPEHVLFGVSALPGRCAARVALENLGLDLAHEAMAVTALAAFQPPAKLHTPPSLAPETERFLNQAKVEARGLGANYVGTEHLVLGLLAGTGAAADFLRERGITGNRFLAEIRKLHAGPHESPRSHRPA